MTKKNTTTKIKIPTAKQIKKVLENTEMPVKKITDDEMSGYLDVGMALDIDEALMAMAKEVRKFIKEYYTGESNEIKRVS